MSSSVFTGRLRVVPSSDFASGAGSSNQFEVFVASFVSEIWAERSAANCVAERSSIRVFEVVFEGVFEDAVTIVVFLRRLTVRPSPSVEV